MRLTVLTSIAIFTCTCFQLSSPWVIQSSVAKTPAIFLKPHSSPTKRSAFFAIEATKIIQRNKERNQRWSSVTLAMKKKISYRLGLGKNSPLFGKTENATAAIQEIKNVSENKIEKKETDVRNWNNDVSSRHELSFEPPQTSLTMHESENNRTTEQKKGGRNIGSRNVCTDTEETESLKEEIQGILDYWTRDPVIVEKNGRSVDDESRYDEDNEKEQLDFVSIWRKLREETSSEAKSKPLLVPILFSSLLYQDSLESALAFHLANRLSSPKMNYLLVMTLFLEAYHSSAHIRRSFREDLLAAKERDPAFASLPDVFLYCKGFHALQAHRVAHYLIESGRKELAHNLQTRMSEVFNLHIHPNATLGSGIVIDHCTGIVIGRAAVIGHNCTIQHNVAIVGNEKGGIDHYPRIGDGVFLGAGACICGNVRVGSGCNVAAGASVLDDMPDQSIAVDAQAKISETRIDLTANSKEEQGNSSYCI